MSLLLAVSGLQAQWKITGVDKSENSSCELIQVLESENSTFVFGTITNSGKGIYPYSTISRSTCVCVDDELYKIINSVNLPIYDEATPVYAQIQEGQKLNFIMEFEKFPVTDGFDLIEKESCHTEGTFNFYGIHIQNAGLDNMADDTFLDIYPSILYGNFANEGKETQYYMFRDMTLICTRDIEYRDQLGQPDIVCFLSFENGSKKDLELTFGTDVWVTGHKDKGNGKEDEKKLKIIKQDEYERYFYGKDYQEAKRIVNPDVAAMSDAATQAKNSTINSDIRGTMGLISLVGDLSIDKDVKQYMKEHPSDRPAALNSCTVKAGEKKAGYVAFQTKKMDYYILHLKLDGYEYKFSWKKE